MADIRAAQSGDFSAGSTWVGGVVPGPGDVAYANSFTVAVRDGATVQAISNASGTGITQGGTFSISNGANLACTNPNGIVQGAVSTPCVTTGSLGAGQSATVTASITASSSSGPSLNHGGAGALTLVSANFQPTALSNTVGSSGCIVVSGSGTFNLNAPAVNGFSTQTGSTNPCSILITGSNCVVAITGNVTGGTVSAGSGPSQPAIRLQSGVNQSLTINGSVTGGSGSLNHAIYMENASTVTVNGPVVSGSAVSAIAAPSSASPVLRLSGPILFGTNSNFAALFTPTPFRWAQNRAPSYMQVRNWNNTGNDNLFTSDGQPTGGYPVAANVLSTAPSYGDAAQYQGAYIPPAANSVASGVAYGPGGAVVGTAVLSAGALRAAIGLAAANLDIQLAALAGSTAPSAASIALQVRAELAGELGRLDASVSSRLASNAYAAPLSAADLRNAVGLSTGNLDDQLATKPSLDQLAAIVQGAVSA